MNTTNKIAYYEDPKVWDQGLQKYQQNLLHTFIDHWPESVSTVLDVGCGDGKITNTLNRHFTNVNFHGVDISEEALKRLEIPHTQASAAELPFADSQFDMVMSTDLIEHLSDADEQKAISELFRVSKEWVILTVPFEENLDESTTICEDCGTIYHINWHQRTYNIQSLLSKLPVSNSKAFVVLSGDTWAPFSPVEITHRRHTLNQWPSWEHAECPKCGAAGEQTQQVEPLSFSTAAELGKKIYYLHNRFPLNRSHSEITVFCNKAIEPHLPCIKYEAEHEKKSSGILTISNENPEESLLPYPMNARVVIGTEGGYVAQFPCFHNAIKDCSFKVLTRNGEPIQDSVIKSIVIEDGAGMVPFSYNMKDQTLHLKREITISYYGLIVRLPINTNIESIELLNCPENNFYSQKSPEKICYFDIDNSTRIQVSKNITFSELSVNLNTMPLVLTQKKILVMCHDQDIDRRVLNQINSLAELGADVQVIALSHSVESHDKILPSGVRLHRVGTGKIRPSNIAYKNYIQRTMRIRRINNRWVNKLHGYNFKIYQMHLALLYHNRKFNDPLCLTSSFYEASQKFNAEMIIVHDLPCLEAAVKRGEELNARVVYDSHELYPEQRTFSKKQKNICKKAEQKLISKVDHVITINESIADEMAKRYNIEKPTVILNSVDVRGATPAEHKFMLHDSLNISRQRRILLFQGGLSPNRNLLNLAKAFKHVKAEDIDLVFLGDGPEKGKIEEIAKNQGLLGNRIYLHPAVPQEDLLHYTASAWMGIIPYPHVDLNSYFCTPNKLFEFIAAEIPVIANESPELKRYTANIFFGFTHTMKSVKCIAKAINRANSIADKNYEIWKSRLACDGHRFTWQKEEAIFVNVIAECLHSNAAVKAA